MKTRFNILGLLVIQGLILTGVLVSINVVANGADPWYTTWGTSDYDYGNDIAIDSDGAIICVGDTDSDANWWDMAVIKLDPNGTLLWANTWGYSDTDFGEAVVVDSARNIYCVGRTKYFTNEELLLVKYFPNGTQAYNISWGSPLADEYGKGIALGPNGTIICCGRMSGTAYPYGAIFLTKFNATTGTLIDYTIEESTQWEDVKDLMVDANGTIYCVGEIYVSGKAYDYQLAKFDSNLARVWNVSWGHSENDLGQSLVIDNEGFIYCIGESWFSSNRDLFLTKFNPAGTMLWNASWGASGSHEAGLGVTIDYNGDIICTGYKERDFAILKYFTNGTLVWAKIWGGNGDDFGYKSAINLSNNIYAIGRTDSFGAGKEDFLIVKFSADGTGPTVPSGIPGFDLPVLIFMTSIFIATYLIVKFRGKCVKIHSF